MNSTPTTTLEDTLVRLYSGTDPRSVRWDLNKILPVPFYMQCVEDFGLALKDLVGLDSPFGRYHTSLVSENSDLNVDLKDSLEANKDLNERIDILADDAVLSQQTIATLQSEKNSLSDNLASLTSNYDSVIEERDALLAGQGQAGTSESSIPVFPYVDWSRANKSKAFYKDANWKDIPFDDLSELETGNIDWSKVNYKEAEQAESFDIDFIDAAGWGEINSAGKKQKKIYKDLNWQGVDYQSLSDDTKEGIDWSSVDYKEAIRSETFNLDSVDIDELEPNPKAFKKFLKATALKKASADSLLAEASSETLEGIGLNNYAGKISEKITKSFSTNSGEYKLVMKPSSFDRASAIAKGMGGTLAVFETEQESDDFTDGLTGVVNDRSISRKILNQTDGLSGASAFHMWLGGPDMADLSKGDDQQSQISVSIIDDINSKQQISQDSKWFIVETGEIRSIVSPQVDQLSTNFDIVSQFDSGIPISIGESSPQVDQLSTNFVYDSKVPISIGESSPQVDQLSTNFDIYHYDDILYGIPISVIPNRGI